MIFKDSSILSKYDNFLGYPQEKPVRMQSRSFGIYRYPSNCPQVALTGDQESLSQADLRLQQERMEISCFRSEGGQILSSFFRRIYKGNRLSVFCLPKSERQPCRLWECSF